METVKRIWLTKISNPRVMTLMNKESFENPDHSTQHADWRKSDIEEIEKRIGVKLEEVVKEVAEEIVGGGADDSKTKESKPKETKKKNNPEQTEVGKIDKPDDQENKPKYPPLDQKRKN